MRVGRTPVWEPDHRHLRLVPKRLEVVPRRTTGTGWTIVGVAAMFLLGVLIWGPW